MADVVKEFEVGSRRIRVSVRHGDGIPLVLCNGIGASLDLLQPFVDRLDPTIPVIRFDAPGVGGSPHTSRPYLLTTLAHTVSAIVTACGYDRFDVLGISWGGGLAQQIAFQNPRRCRRLVLASTGTGWMMLPASPRVLSKMVTPRRYRDRSYAESIAAELYGGLMRDEPERAKDLLNGRAPVTSGRGYYLQLLAAAGWTSLPFLRFIRQRTLILAGDDDPIIPLVNGRIMQRLLPNADLHVFHDGHLGLVTQAEKLGPLVSQFLREQ